MVEYILLRARFLGAIPALKLVKLDGVASGSTFVSCLNNSSRQMP